MNNVMSEELPAYLNVDGRVLDLGYKTCRSNARQLFGPFRWMLGHVTGNSRRGMDAFMGHLAQVSNFLELMSTDGRSVGSWQGYRGAVSHALAGNCLKPELAALAETVSRFQIPHQFVFDPVNAADSWIRTQRFETMEQYESFTSRLGGSSLAAAFSILDIQAERKRWQVRAIQGGQAILQAHLLSLFVRDLFQGKVFLPQSELDACQVDLDQVRAGEADKSFRHFCRVQVAHIESNIKNLGPWVHSFELDGQRVMTSLLAYVCQLLIRIKSDPSILFQPDGPFSKKEMFVLRAKHLMGLEGNVPIIPDKNHH